MPKLLLPILLKPDLITYHKIIKFLFINEENLIATGSLKGDIILWKNEAII